MGIDGGSVRDRAKANQRVSWFWVYVGLRHVQLKASLSVYACRISIILACGCIRHIIDGLEVGDTIETDIILRIEAKIGNFTERRRERNHLLSSTREQLHWEV